MVGRSRVGGITTEWVFRHCASGRGGENYAVFLVRLKPGSELVVEHERWVTDP
ncbi:hypothetical protein BH23GEM3_BH23GEM3_07730 [soil metagenome]